MKNLIPTRKKEVIELIEEGKNTSFYWNKSNMIVIQDLGLDKNSDSAVLNRGIEALKTEERMKKLKERLLDGDADISDVITELNRI